MGDEVQPGIKTSCSTELRWSALLARSFESSTTVHEFETRETPDQLVVVVLRGECVIESLEDRTWKKAVYRPGLGGLTAGMTTNRLRWRSQKPGIFETQHIFLPAELLLSVKEEYRLCGTPLKEYRPDTLLLADPVVYQAALSLRGAMAMGAPELYAETVGQFLALRLLSMQSKWDCDNTKRQAGSVSDRRLTRVLDYMDENYAKSVTLERLAQEAGISRFHFVRLFRARVGVTPHRHLVHLRMAAAEAMLKQSELSVSEVAFACGYTNEAHFSTAFKRHFALAPRQHRLEIDKKAPRHASEPARPEHLKRA